MKRKCIAFLLIYTAAGFLCFSEDFYSDFLKTHNAYAEKSAATFFIQSLREFNASGELLNETPAKSLCLGSSQITRISQKNGDFYFLSTKAGYWIKNKKLLQPMKISGSYKVMDIQMQDLLRLDFENDFERIEGSSAEGYVLLKKVNKKNSYSYLKLEKPGADYRIEVLDNNRNKIKTMVYEKGTLNGVELFTRISICDDFLTAGTRYEYITKDSKTAKVSKALFSPNYMDELMERLDAQ